MATIGAVGISLAAIGYLAATDPKRRRTFRMPEVAVRWPRLAWTVALLPGLLVPSWSGGAGFVTWLGATATLGWILVALPPKWIETLRLGLGRWRSPCL